MSAVAELSDLSEPTVAVVDQADLEVVLVRLRVRPAGFGLLFDFWEDIHGFVRLELLVSDGGYGVQI